MATQSLEDVLASPKQQQERRLMRPQPDQSLKCPRCDSTNTKFCYYNNYSLSQPRYFCKACRRYWTKGGSLRNVPVGGGCRKNKRSSSSSSSKKINNQLGRVLDPASSNTLTSLPPLTYDACSDLTLAFDHHHHGVLHKQPTKQLLLDGPDHHHDTSMFLNATNDNFDFLGNPSSTSGTPGFLDSFRSSFLDGPSNLHKFCPGFGGGKMGEMENCGDNCEDMVLPYDGTGAPSAITTAKQELYDDGRSNGENRMFWNFPWQLGGDQGNYMGSVDSGRECWNGLGSSSWHGIVNSSLM